MLWVEVSEYRVGVLGAMTVIPSHNSLRATPFVKLKTIEETVRISLFTCNCGGGLTCHHYFSCGRLPLAWFSCMHSTLFMVVSFLEASSYIGLRHFFRLST